MSGDDLPPPPPMPAPGGDTEGGAGVAPPSAPASPPAASPPPPPPPPGLTAPAGYVAYNTAPTRGSQLSAIRGSAKWAMILAGVTAVATVVSAFLTASLASKAQDFLDGRIGEQEFLDANAIAPLGQLLSAAPMIAAGVFAVMWMFKMANNLRAIGRATTFAPVFAIVGWILPPFLFVLPLLVLRELWKASDPQTPPGSDGWRSSGESPVLYGWFLFYGVIPAVLTVINLTSIFDAALNLDTDATSIAEVAAATSSTQIFLGAAVNLVAGVLWILLVKQLTARHVELTGER